MAKIAQLLPNRISIIDINNFIFGNALAGTVERNDNDSSTVRIGLTFKDQDLLMRFGSSCAILAIRFSLHCSLFLWARNWGKILNPKKSSCQL